MSGGSLWGMHTFETSIRSSSFRLAVLLLPLGFWAVVQTVATQARDVLYGASNSAVVSGFGALALILSGVSSSDCASCLYRFRACARARCCSRPARVA